jgi:hypothetical protein
MKKGVVAASVLVLVLFLAGCAADRSSYYGRHRPRPVDSLALMTKGDVVRLSQSKVGDGVIINMIKSSGSTFVLRTPDVVALADSGVSDSVITAMLRTTEEPSTKTLTRRYEWYPTWYGGVWYPFWGSWYSSLYYNDYWPGYYTRPFYRGHYGGYYGGGPRMGGGAPRGSSGRHR